MDIFISPSFKKDFEENPIVLVDVGASGGLQPHWKPAEPHLHRIAFEPDKRGDFESAPGKAKSQVTSVRTALFNKKTSLELYLGRKQQVSSIFKPNRALLDRFPEAERFDIVGQENLPADTLDHQLSLLRVDDVDFIKLDAQGCELAILEGSQETLKKPVFGMEVEVEFAPIYENQPLFSDVDPVLRKHGFELFDLKPCYWKRAAGKDLGQPQGQIIFADALYLRNLEVFKQSVGSFGSTAEKRAKVLKTLGVCILYGYIDYAMETLDRLKGFLTGEDVLVLEKKLKSARHLYTRIPNFKGGKPFLARHLLALWKLLQPTHRGWAVIRPDIGNR